MELSKYHWSVDHIVKDVARMSHVARTSAIVSAVVVVIVVVLGDYSRSS